MDHQLLIKKLHRVGVGGNLLAWFENYLTDRHQQVTVLGKTSQSIPVLSGVPQGSILGPLLFLVYGLFADDTKCYRAIRTTEDVKHLQCDLDGINKWCQTWRMNLNQSKCDLLSVTNRKQVLSSYHLTNDDPTNTSILVTTDLKWNHQISAVCTKANKILGFVKRSTVNMTNSRTVVHYTRRW